MFFGHFLPGGSWPASAGLSKNRGHEIACEHLFNNQALKKYSLTPVSVSESFQGVRLRIDMWF